MPVRLTSKGQATIPKRIRDHLCVGPGGLIDFLVDLKGRVILRPVHGKKPKSRIDRWAGFLRDGMTTDQVMKMTRGKDWSARR